MFFRTLREYIASDFDKVKPKQIKSYVSKKKDSFIAGEKQKKKQAREQSMSRTKFAFVMLWRNKYVIVALTLAFMILTSFYFYNTRDNRIITTMSLNYQEGSKGLNPNSTRFNMYELKSDEVMQRAVQYMGLGDVLTPEELANNISIDNTNQKQITVGDESSYFISTSFLVDYKRNNNLGRLSTNDAVNMICKAYNDIFHEKYSDNQSALIYNMDNMDEMEYVEIGDALNSIADMMKTYLSRRVKENGTFKSEITGETFQTVSRLLQNLQDYQIAKYCSYVLETGLAKNKTEFIQTLYYNNSVLDMKYQRSMANYAVRQDGITKYDEAMIGTVMIPSINEKDDYYMSRTNIGIDYLAKDAETHLSEAKDTLKKIEINNNIISRLEERTPTLDDFSNAESMLKEINNEFDRISQIALETDREYIKYNTKDYMTFMRSEQSIFDKIGLKKSIVAGAAFFVLICILFYIVGSRRAGKGGRA